ncbi:uncharacterized protein LOC131436357 [Malaya genurostris]|uniref:uncharacterized protein LOC131436357 n=1 Tax=Malaya genurostris TaxID=325434 RepID=UPI0026F3E7C4|nr:uncharacterized protein LOC131436357 [Malaya genurostris]XP_058461018.1 uncharacterized protein LOC131436357 [Malaya genurostris]
MDSINSLPFEILEKIFDYLDLYERSCALATCKHWHSILNCTRFQRQRRLALAHIFQDELTEQEKIAVQKCCNLRVVHYEDSGNSDSESAAGSEGDQNEQRIGRNLHSIENLFRNTPEQNLNDLLFGRVLDLESLSLETGYEICRNIIRDRLDSIKNLNELVLLFTGSRFPTPDTGLWTIRHAGIQILKVQMPVDGKHLSFIVPSLTSLELIDSFRWSLNMLNTHSEQLRCLKLKLRHIEMLDDLFPLTFPNMTYLEIRNNPYKTGEQLRFTQTRNVLDEQMEQRFVEGMPRLKKLLLEGKFTFLRMGMSLARCAHTLEELVLEDQEIEYALLKSVEMLPNLKNLTISECKFRTSSDMLPTLNLPHLERFNLFNYRANIVFDKGLGAVNSLGLTLWADKNYKVLHKICENMSNLERLELFVNVKLSNNALRHLNKMGKLKSLMFHYTGPSLQAWKHCPEVLSVRKLSFRGCEMDRSTLLSVVEAFPNLYELFLDKCILFYCGDTVELLEHNYINADGDNQCREELRQLLPLCRISLMESLLCCQHSIV